MSSTARLSCFAADSNATAVQEKARLSQATSEKYKQHARDAIKWGNREEAVSWFEKARKECPTDEFSSEEVRCLLEMGRPEQALQVLGKGPTYWQNGVAFNVEKTEILIKLHRFDEALKLCDTFNHIDAAFIFRSQIFELTGKHAEAVAQANIAYYNDVSLDSDSKESIENLKSLGAKIPTKVEPITRENKQVFNVLDGLFKEQKTSRAALEKMFHRSFHKPSSPYESPDSLDVFSRLLYADNQSDFSALTITVDTKQATLTCDDVEKHYPGGQFKARDGENSCTPTPAIYTYTAGKVTARFTFNDAGFKPVTIITIRWKTPNAKRTATK